MLKFKEAIEAQTARGVVLPDIYYNVMQPAMRSLAFSVAGVSKVSQLEVILDLLVDSLDSGMSFADWKKGLLAADKSIFGLPKYRLDNIYRTNTQTAFMHGKAEFIKEHQDTREYLLYSAVGDERTRETHLAHDGRVEPVDSPFWGAWYPPNGFMCRCSAISLGEDAARARRAKDTREMTTEKQTARSIAKPDTGWDYSILTGKLSEQTRRSLKPHYGGNFDIFLNDLTKNLDDVDRLL